MEHQWGHVRRSEARDFGLDGFVLGEHDEIGKWW